MTTTEQVTKDYLGKEGNAWFSSMINELEWDRVMMQKGVAPAETKKFYEDVFSGNISDIMKGMRDQSAKYFARGLFEEYVKQLVEKQARPHKLAFDLTNSTILVWAEIADSDMDTEKALILSEAYANAKFDDMGYHITSMIVEESDALDIPNHYQEVPLHKH